MKRLCQIMLFVVLFAAAAVAQTPVPFISLPLSPGSVVPGGAGFTLTVNGAGFLPTSVVNWNGTALPTTFVNNKQLTAAVPASDVAAPGSASVTVSTSGKASNPVSFFMSRVSNGFGLQQKDLAPRAMFDVTAADFNGDGKTDLAFVQENPLAVLVLIGHGDGTFDPPVTYDAGINLNSIYAADLNGDGHLDIAVGSYQSSTVSILLNNGDGTFQSGFPVTVGNFMETLAFGDLNRDGKLDMVVTTAQDISPFNSLVSVLLGNGDGTFQAPTDYVVGAIGIESKGVALADFNNDGLLDVVVANDNVNGTTNSTLPVLLGNGDGTLQAPVGYTVGIGPIQVVAADFNHDGNIDLATGNTGNTTGLGSGTISVLLGNGDGTFQGQATYPISPGAFLMRTADVNGDNQLDLVFNEALGGTGFIEYSEIGVLLGLGDGTFKNQVPVLAGDMFPRGLTLGDFDGSGKPGIVAAQGTPTGSVLYEQSPVQISAQSYQFGTDSVGRPTGQTKAFILTNAGFSPLDITSIALSGDTADYTQTNNCPSSLNAGTNCTITTTFMPATAGSLTGNITITDSAKGGTQTIVLLGTGVDSIADLFPIQVQYNKVQVGKTAGPAFVSLTNIGGRTLNVSQIAMGGLNPGDFAQTNNCGSTLAPGATCSFQITFTPTAQGPRSAKLLVGDDGGQSPQRVSLAGFGT